MIEIGNPSSTDEEPESSSWNPKSKAWDPEPKSNLGSLTRGDTILAIGGQTVFLN